MSRAGALLFQICERLLGLSALLGAVGIWRRGNEVTSFWRTQFGATPFGGALDDRTLAMAMGGALALFAAIFLVPPLSRWVHRRRTGVVGFVAFAFIFVGVGIASWVAAICFDRGFPEFRQYAFAWFTIVIAASVVHLIRQLTVNSAAAREARLEEIDRQTAGKENTTYRIIETQMDDEAAQSIEERRRRLIFEANINRLPKKVREGLLPISRLRAVLCAVILTPVVTVAGLGAYGMTMAHFLPTRELTELALAQMGPFLLYCAVAGAYFAAFGPRFTTRLKRPRNRIVMGALFAVLLAVLGRFSFYAAITTGAPDLEALRNGGPAARAAVLVVRRSDEGAAFCGRWVDIRVAPGAPMHRLCRLDGALVDKVASGDRLLVSGVATRFGIRYHDIRH